MKMLLKYFAIRKCWKKIFIYCIKDIGAMDNYAYVKKHEDIEQLYFL